MAFRILLALLLIVFLIVTPPYLRRELSRDRVHEMYEYREPEWVGVIELWHIVGFRTYQGSATRFLTARAEAYMALHDGVYIEVTGMTEAAYQERVARGESPDAYSFPLGLLYADALAPLDVSPPAFQNGAAAAEAGGTVYALPWLMSGYFLLMNAQKLSACGISLPETAADAPLADAMLFSESQLAATPVQAALCGLTGTPAAYADFLKGRLLFAIADARALGDLTRDTDANLLFSALPFALCTEQVQYLAAARNTDAERLSVLSDFFSFLLSQETQLALTALGALPVTAAAGNAQFTDARMEALFAAYRETAPLVPDAFLYQRHRDALISDAYGALSGDVSGRQAFFERAAVVFRHEF